MSTAVDCGAMKLDGRQQAVSVYEVLSLADAESHAVKEGAMGVVWCFILEASCWRRPAALPLPKVTPLRS